MCFFCIDKHYFTINYTQFCGYVQSFYQKVVIIDIHHTQEKANFVCTFIELSYILKIETLINKGFPKCKSHACGSVSTKRVKKTKKRLIRCGNI